MTEKDPQVQLSEGVRSLFGSVSVSVGHTTSSVESELNEVYRFESLTSAGIKLEATPPVTYKTAEAAVSAYLSEFGAYWRKKGYLGCVLYWRETPTIKRADNPAGGGWYVYSRLTFGPPGLHDSAVVHVQSVLTGPVYLQPGWRGTNKGPNPENKSGFRATGHRILLKPEIVERKSAGGLFLPEKTVVAEEQRAVIATVLEIGPDAWTDKSTDYCEVGDRVLIGMYVGKFHESPVDGVTYRFVSDLDIISPLPKVEAP